jgi:hypothetical protein
MPHNVSLPTHRYVWVIPSFVLRGQHGPALIPAMWVGVSVTPGRALGCHVLLENGALVVDVPLHALRGAMVEYVPLQLSELVAWDCFGWSAEAWQPEVISGLSCAILSEDHKQDMGKGHLWFCIDHTGDGYSLTPEQHKHLWIVERERDRALMLLPQDRMLIQDLSFTHINGIPPIKRQAQVWYAE